MTNLTPTEKDIVYATMNVKRREIERELWSSVNDKIKERLKLDLEIIESVIEKLR